MAITIRNVLNANVVLAGISLLNTPLELKAFMDGINVDEVVSHASLQSREPSPNADAERTFSLGKERITLDILCLGQSWGGTTLNGKTRNS